MKAPEITPSVRSAMVGNSNVYLLSRSDRHILVDTGASGGFPKLKGTLEKWGVRFEDIVLIVITHAHYDHTGSTYEMAAITSAPVAAHVNAVPLLSAGEISVPAGITTYGRILSRLGRALARRNPGMGRYHPVVPSVIVSDRLDLSPYGFDGEILYTPGHTDDSLSIVLSDGNCCTGDCCFNMPPFPWTSVVPPLADYPGQLKESMIRLLEAGATRLYPGHGPAFTAARLEKSIGRGQQF